MSGTSNSETKGAVSRWPELRAAVAWCARSWLHPAGDSLGWEQRAGRETSHGTGLGRHHESSTQADRSTESNRQQNIKQTGAGT